jgi:hypothetical protein
LCCTLSALALLCFYKKYNPAWNPAVRIFRCTVDTLVSYLESGSPHILLFKQIFRAWNPAVLISCYLHIYSISSWNPAVHIMLFIHIFHAWNPAVHISCCYSYIACFESGHISCYSYIFFLLESGSASCPAVCTYISTKNPLGSGCPHILLFIHTCIFPV